MARVEVPPIDCPYCGEPLEVVTTGNVVVANELVIDFVVKPCTGWCQFLDEAGAR